MKRLTAMKGLTATLAVIVCFAFSATAFAQDEPEKGSIEGVFGAGFGRVIGRQTLLQFGSGLRVTNDNQGGSRGNSDGHSHKDE